MTSMAPSEKNAVTERMREQIVAAAKARQAQAGPKAGRGKKKSGSDNCPEPLEEGQTRDIVAARVGWSGLITVELIASKR